MSRKDASELKINLSLSTVVAKHSKINIGFDIFLKIISILPSSKTKI